MRKDSLGLKHYYPCDFLLNQVFIFVTDLVIHLDLDLTLSSRLRVKNSMDNNVQWRRSPDIGIIRN